MIFIDFDDVILNTKDFVDELKNFFKDNGVSEELFKKYYYSENADISVKLFNPWALLDCLEKYESMEVENIRTKFCNFIQNLSKFVFPDTCEFLTAVGKEDIYIISFGLPSYQNEKIQACGIDKLVSGCVVTKNSKADAIEKIILQMEISKEERLVFIDDRVQQIQEVKEKFPNCQTFLICRKEGRYCDQKNEFCDFEVQNLKEVQDIISKL